MDMRCGLTDITLGTSHGSLQIILLKRLPMDRGSRNAITTIFSYAIFALGIIVAFNAIGLKWSSLQWLVAALGVGIGFADWFDRTQRGLGDKP